MHTRLRIAKLLLKWLLRIEIIEETYVTNKMNNGTTKLVVAKRIIHDCPYKGLGNHCSFGLN